MREIELYATIASLSSEHSASAYKYPQEEISKIWEDVVRALIDRSISG